jgi:hypothetical protein
VKNISVSALTLSRLENLPKPGGTHLWLAQIAGGLKRRISTADCSRFLRAVCDRLVTHRHIDDREIEGAIEFAYSTSVCVSGRKLSWPEQDTNAIRQLLARTDIPVLFGADSESGIDSQTALAGLFLPAELVCVGEDVNKTSVKPTTAWVKYVSLHSLTYVCPNPLCERFTKRSDGSIQIRCQANVATRRWLIVEADDLSITKHDQAKILSALSLLLPLAMVVDSGGKSLHGWFHVEGREWKEIVGFFYRACALGADKTKFDKCGWVRLPGGTRRKDTGEHIPQRILYWNPEVMQKHTNLLKEGSNV